MTKRILLIIICIFINTLSFDRVQARKITAAINSGISRQYGWCHEYFEPRAHYGGRIHFYISDNISVGINASYVSWGLVESNEIGIISYSDHWNTCGSADMLEVVPNIEILSGNRLESSLSIYLRAGLGYYDIDYNVEYYDPVSCLDQNYASPSCEHRFLKYDRSNVGLFTGAGIYLNLGRNLYVEAWPSFRSIFMEKSDDIFYLSGNIGFGFVY